MSTIRDQITKTIQKATGVEDVRLEVPEIETYGDYSTNIAMQLFSASKFKDNQRLQMKAHYKVANPRKLAEHFVEELNKDKGLKKMVDRIEIAGPGFINFWLSKSYLLENLQEVIKQADQYGASRIGNGQTVLVEYSAPNIARRFGIGHLRSTIIGQALYNTFKFLGYKTIGENHLGDWGTQFGMIISEVIDKSLDIKALSVPEIEKLYVDYNKRVVDKPELRDKAKEWFKKLEGGDKKAREIWQGAVDVSLKEFEKIYSTLNVKIDNAHGESFYQDKMPSVIDEVRKKGLSKKSQGAEIVELEGMPPLILLKSDGATTYQTRDLAAIKYRLDIWKPQKLIYEVGMEQKLHFRQIFKTARLLGWVTDQETVHVAHGHFLFHGKKMSTRFGKTVKLEEVLSESVKRARDIIENSETGRGLSIKEREKVSYAVGIGAVKYFDLSHRPTSNIEFDWENILSLQGNSGPYLQYTVARTNSVLAKLKTSNSKLIAKKGLESLVLGLKLNSEELLLLRAFPQFPEVIVDVAKSYSPNLLCNYLFDLAQKYNVFYNKHGILEQRTKNKEQSDFRLALTVATGQILKNGLTLLGIQAPERM